MSANAGQIDYIIDMDTRPFLQQTRRVQSENTRLGRSFNGLDDTVGRLNGSFGMAAGGMSRLSVGISQAIGPIGIATAAMTAATAATLQFTAAAASAANEIAVLAERANTNTSNFQAWAHAAKSVNLGMEEVSSIFKDVNDRIGEFTGEGTGELEHAFEKFLKPAGLTVETLREMAGQDALQAIVKGMQEGGASANEMTAVLEMVASNASHLLPLLKNNGKAARELFDDAKNKGLIISNEQIQQAKEFDRQWKLLGGQIAAVKNVIALEVMPEMMKLVGWAKAAAEWISKITGNSPVEELKKLKEELKEIDEAISNKSKGPGISLIDALNPFAVKGDIKYLEQQRLEKVAAIAAAEKAMSKINAEVESPRLNFNEPSSSTFKPFTMPDAMIEKTKKEGQKAGKSFMLGFGEAMYEGDGFANSTLDSDVSLMEKLINERELILEYQELEFGDAETHAQRLIEIDKKMADEKRKNQQDILSASESFFGSMAGMVGAFAGEQSGAYKALFAVSKGFAVANAALQLQTAIANAMALPWPANLPAISQAVALGGQVVSTIGGISYGGGRENGGGVSSSSYYQMGEGNKPEVLQTGSGMFVVPGDNGRVFNQGQLEQINGGGGGSMINLNVYTSGGGDQVSMQQDGNNVNLVIGELVNQMDNKTGPFNAGLKRNFLIKENLS